MGGSASGGGSQLNQGPAAQVAGLGASALESGKASIEGQLTEARFSAHALIDATSDAFVEVRPDGVVVQMLSSTAYGYTPAQLLGRSLLTICHTDEHPGLLQTMQALLMMAGAQRAGRGVSHTISDRGSGRRHRAADFAAELAPSPPSRRRPRRGELRVSDLSMAWVSKLLIELIRLFVERT